MLNLALAVFPVASRGGTALIKRVNLTPSKRITLLKKIWDINFCALNVARLLLLNASPLIFLMSLTMCQKKKKKEKKKHRKKKNQQYFINELLSLPSLLWTPLTKCNYSAQHRYYIVIKSTSHRVDNSDGKLFIKAIWISLKLRKRVCSAAATLKNEKKNSLFGGEIVFLWQSGVRLLVSRVPEGCFLSVSDLIFSD